MNHHPMFPPVPGVGVCTQDLHHLATSLVSAFGSNAGSTANANDVLTGAINQAGFELRTIAGVVEKANQDLHYAILGVCERLEAASETATTIEKLLATIRGPS